MPDSVDFILFRSIDASMYKARDCNSDLIKKRIRSLELTMKNIPRIDNKTKIGYSNFEIFISFIKF